MAPRDAKAAYFRNLIDRWKCVESFGEGEFERGCVKSECEVPKQCWRSPDDQVYDEDKLLRTKNGEDFSHDPGPRDVPVRLLPVIN